jgi:hypothetical protein
MVWIRRLFFVAGIYGLLIVTPQYFLESRINRDQPPAITHPEYFYGFIGVVLVWQLVYITIGTNPIRYRPIMLLAGLAKFSFTTAAVVLYALGRIPITICIFASIDFALGVLFVVAYFRIRSHPLDEH